MRADPYRHGRNRQRKFDLFAVAAVQVGEAGFIGFDFFDLEFAMAVVAYLKDRGDGGVRHSWGGHSGV